MISLFGGIFFEGDNNLANRGSLEYLLAEVHGEDFPGETFHVLKEKEIKQFGEYRTRRLASAASGGVG